MQGSIAKARRAPSMASPAEPIIPLQDNSALERTKTHRHDRDPYVRSEGIYIPTTRIVLKRMSLMVDYPHLLPLRGVAGFPLNPKQRTVEVSGF